MRDHPRPEPRSKLSANPGSKSIPLQKAKSKPTVPIKLPDVDMEFKEWNPGVPTPSLQSSKAAAS